MDISYRKITADNWADILPLLQELHLDHHNMRPDVYLPTTELHQNNYRDKFFGYGAYYGDGMVGLCWGYIHHNGRTDAVGFVEDFVVTSKFRRNGIGLKLFTLFEQECSRRGATALELLTVADNTKAIMFYRGHGMTTLSLHLRKSLSANK